MAGMFCSLEEAAQKLGISAEQIGKLVEEGKLREFHDRSNVLFKVSEVEALMADTGLVGAQEQAVEAEGSEPPQVQAGEEELTLQPEVTGELGTEAEQEELSLDDSLALLGEGEELGQEPAAEEDLSLPEETGQVKQEPSETKEDTEVSFALDEQQGSGLGADLTDADTAITSEGISVLDESDSRFKLAEDTAAETKAMEEAASLEKIEEDVNLDTFGSGSGLLDLSLQADDTSLGGILDEIYTPAGDEGATPTGGPAAASAADVAAEAEHILAHEELAGAPAAVMQGYVEPEPDTSSNVFGGLLLLPLLVVSYTLLVTIAGQFGVLSSLIPKGMTIIYALVGVFVVALAVAGYGWMQGAPAKPKAAKVKKEKAPKVKKEKPKKEKPVKEKKEKKK
jgi:excisionase family DNA binding protein